MCRGLLQVLAVPSPLGPTLHDTIGWYYLCSVRIHQDLLFSLRTILCLTIHKAIRRALVRRLRHRTRSTKSAKILADLMASYHRGLLSHSTR